jgi:hypothetical protein
MKFKWLLTLSVSFFVMIPMAQAEVSPEQVESMLQQMVTENVISAEEAEKAKVKMKAMKPDQWAQINKQAATVAAARGPASVPSSNSISEVKNIDLDGAQFKQIQDDIKKIIPEFKE